MAPYYSSARSPRPYGQSRFKTQYSSASYRVASSPYRVVQHSTARRFARSPSPTPSLASSMSTQSFVSSRATTGSAEEDRAYGAHASPVTSNVPAAVHHTPKLIIVTAAQAHARPCYACSSRHHNTFLCSRFLYWGPFQTDHPTEGRKYLFSVVPSRTGAVPIPPPVMRSTRPAPAPSPITRSTTPPPRYVHPNARTAYPVTPPLRPVTSGPPTPRLLMASYPNNIGARDYGWSGKGRWTGPYTI